MNETPKAALRNSLLSKRRRLSAVKRQEAADKATRLFLSSSLFNQAQTIACYSPTAHEFDCRPLVQAILQASKACYLPVMSLDTKTLFFSSYHADDILTPNSYGLLEPTNTYCIALEDLDLIILPLVGFDLSGYRLGIGGGYYDKTLSHLSPKKTNPFLLGLAYDIQQVETIPRDPWDIPLNAVLTENALRYF